MIHIVGAVGGLIRNTKLNKNRQQDENNEIFIIVMFGDLCFFDKFNIVF